MQRPLYGLATDLTPLAVIGPALGAPVPSAPVLLAPTPRPVRLAQPAVPVRRRSASGAPSEPTRLVAAAVAVGVIAITWFITGAQLDPKSAVAAQTASVGAVPAASAITPPSAPVPTPGILPPKPEKPRPLTITSKPTNPWASRGEPTDADLAATLERLREGIR